MYLMHNGDNHFNAVLFCCVKSLYVKINLKLAIYAALLLTFLL